MHSIYRHRVLDLGPALEQRSVFLFGPRQTGKSCYVREQLKPEPTLSYNLLNGGLRLRFLADPTLMRREMEACDIPAFARFLQTIL